MSYSGVQDLCDRRREVPRDLISNAQKVPMVVLTTDLGCRARDTDVSITKAETMEAHDDDTLLTPSEVAAMFRVNPKTVTRWARAGKISAIRTLGGHRRFRASEIRHFLEHVEEADRI